MPAVLLVEDEPSIGSLVRTYLERDGLEVAWARSGRAALARLQAGPVALVVLDLGLPDLDGLDVARAVPPAVPVVVLTARGEEEDRLAGFAAGADDYVTKPFSPRELVARVRAVLRRAGRDADLGDEELVLGPLRLRPAGREAWLGPDALALTLREFDLLAHLVRHAGRVVGRDELLQEVWGFAAAGQTRTVDVHVAQVRAKLGGAALIRTVRGIGYRALAP